MIQVSKKKRENTLTLLKRFGKKVKQSSNLARFKKNKYKSRNKSDLKKKREALSRVKREKRKTTLYKLGKLG